MMADGSRTEQNLGGDAAIGRIPVVSTSGEELMPCKPAKALSLLESGKAVRKWNENGTFYIRLRFDPKPPVVHPETGLIKDGERLSLKRRSEDKERTGSLVEEAPSIQCEELVRALKAGKKNGRCHRLTRSKDGRVQLGLLNASISYLRRGYRIISATLREALEAILERLEPPSCVISKRRILRKGEEKAAELLNKFCRLGILGWAPQLSTWLKSEAYKLWLGITQINSPPPQAEG